MALEGRLFGTRLREVYAAISYSAQSHWEPSIHEKEVTPVGLVIARIIELLIIFAVVGFFAKAVEVWLRWIGFSLAYASKTSGFLWGGIAVFSYEFLHKGISKRINIRERIAPCFGHRLYKTYLTICGK